MRFVGALEPGEEAPFWAFQGEHWRAEIAESGAQLIEWKIRHLTQLKYVIPIEPNTTPVEDEAEGADPSSTVAPQPKVVFQNAAHSSREVFWVSPDNGDESSMGEI